MKKGANLIYLLFTAAALVFIILWQLFFKAGTSFYLVCVIVIVLSLLPFFISYENSKPSAREVSLVAVLSALAVASRAVFYFVPQFKPIGAVVIVSAVCLGPQRGYIILFSAKGCGLRFKWWHSDWWASPPGLYLKRLSQTDGSLPQSALCLPLRFTALLWMQVPCSPCSRITLFRACLRFMRRAFLFPPCSAAQLRCFCLFSARRS